VECYSGLEYAERPIALYWNDERLEIETIEAEWRTPDGKKFRVRTTDGQVFELMYVELLDKWRIQRVQMRRT
jgi:hypothetical protein